MSTKIHDIQVCDEIQDHSINAGLSLREHLHNNILPTTSSVGFESRKDIITQWGAPDLPCSPCDKTLFILQGPLETLNIFNSQWHTVIDGHVYYLFLMGVHNHAITSSRHVLLHLSGSIQHRRWNCSSDPSREQRTQNQAGKQHQNY